MLTGFLLARRHKFGRGIGTIAEKEFLHLLFQELARLGLDRRKPVLIDQYGLLLHPLLPGFFGNIVKDTLAQVTGVGRPVEAFRLFAEFYAIYHSGHVRYLPHVGSVALPAAV